MLQDAKPCDLRKRLGFRTCSGAVCGSSSLPGGTLPSGFPGDDLPAETPAETRRGRPRLTALDRWLRGGAGEVRLLLAKAV